MRSHILTVLLFMMLGLVACKKDELVLADLTTNPFDADYNGTPIFTVVSTSTTIVTINGSPVRQLKVTVQVHTELFGRPTPYLVRVQRLFEGTSSSTAPSGSTGDRFDILKNNAEQGTEYCWNLNLGNASTYGGGNSLCGTAE